MTENEIPPDVESLAIALRSELGAEVEVERVQGTARYRLAVVSPRFRDMGQMARQDLVWQIADSALDRESALKITLILAFAPEDIETPTDSKR